jgi:hypothetical protein
MTGLGELLEHLDLAGPMRDVGHRVPVHRVPVIEAQAGMEQGPIVIGARLHRLAAMAARQALRD